MKNIFICLLLSFVCSLTMAQNLPRDYYFSADGRTLFVGGKPTTGFYDEAVIQQIRIQLPQTNYRTLLAANYAAKRDLGGTMWINGVKYDSVGVRYKGQTSYQRVTNDKKSFNISLDYKYPNQNIDGYQSFNFNNTFEDPSMMREVFYYHSIRRHSMAAKSNFLHIFVNGQDYGLYESIQQQNKDFLSDWFVSNDGPNWRAEGTGGTAGGGGFGAGTSSMNYIDDDTTTYKKHYTLKSADVAYPWKDFPKVTKILNKNPLETLEKDLKDVLDVDRTLWHLGSEILFGDDDSYINKGGMDYYVCQEATTGRFMSYDYDGNTVMASRAATWSPFYGSEKTTFPLLNRLLAVPTIRQRYLAHLRTLINEALDDKTTTALIDKYKALVDSVVTKDPIKFSTYAAFQTEVTALKTFVKARREYLLANDEVKQVGPTISETSYYTLNKQWQQPTAADAVTIRTKAVLTGGVSRVTLYYGTGIYGKFDTVEMFDDGKNDDGAANDGVYGAKISKQTASTYVRYYIEAIANTTAKTASYAPVGADHDVYIYQVQSELTGLAPNKDIVINEVVASNQNGAKDEAGQKADWIELYNNSDKMVDLSGYYLTDDWAKPKKWAIPTGTQLPAKGYLIVWADESSKDGVLHANFKLSADGEFLMLINKQLQIADSLSFGPQKADIAWARTPNGTGKFASRTPTHKANNDTGTPGPTTPTTPTNPSTTVTGTNLVTVAEILTVSPNPTQDFIEVKYNTKTKAVLAITNLQGQKIYAADFEEYIKIQTQNWPAGSYILKVNGISKKIIKN
jgi:CotH kinase protein/Lamin Tail Domain/Secretion system C-terminal sorting domain